MSDFTVTAILAAYNEEDIVGAALQHLIAQGVSVYFIDHGSTDGTLEEARRFVDKGVIGVESLSMSGPTFRWADLLRRKEQLARELPGSWFIHHDADELRESPWSGVSLREALRQVDAAGYNAVDFEVLQFRPVHDDYRKGDDLLAAFPHYEPAREYDKLQIKCWKRSQVELAASGGHDAQLAERRVFPVRFLLRHYPIRTQAQGARKVFRERLPRFDPAERALGWHRQYEGAREGQSFLRDPATLTKYDADAVRMRLCVEHRGMEEQRRELDQRAQDLAWYRREWAQREAELAQARADVESARSRLLELEAALAATGHARDEAERDAAALREALAHLEGVAQTRQKRIEELLASWSWRTTAPARLALRRLRGY
jgi:hypothetical protein